MNTYQGTGARVEVVTAMFVASGIPEEARELGRFLEALNNPAGARQIALADAAVRPLYRAAEQTPLGATMLVRRDEIIFANFDGPFLSRPAVRPTMSRTPVLLLAPPFQISGAIEMAPGADPMATLRLLTNAFFLVRDASVFDADGNLLGEGDEIVVNGAAVQLAAPTRARIAVAAMTTPRTHQSEAPDIEAESRLIAARAA